MPKKIFIICTTDSMISSFLLPYIALFEEKGYTVRCFCSRTGSHFDVLLAHGVDVTEMPFTRNPLSLSNLRAFRQLKPVLQKEQPEMVFCHEPVGGVMGRLAGKAAKAKVIYMVHGFHFYKGAPLLNWLLFYPIEKAMSFFTDILITINTEDYAFAQKHMRAKRIAYLAGVGIDISRYDDAKAIREEKRRTFGFTDEDLVLISVGELNDNKNHVAVLKAMQQCGLTNVHYLIAGVGDTEEFLLSSAKQFGLDKQLHLLGYRNDCQELYAASDVFCFPSFREGLSVALMEAMASSLPVIASRIRGNVDLIQPQGGVLLAPDDVDGIATAIEQMTDKAYRQQCGKHNRKVIDNYELSAVLPQFYQMIDCNTGEE